MAGCVAREGFFRPNEQAHIVGLSLVVGDAQSMNVRSWPPLAGFNIATRRILILNWRPDVAVDQDVSKLNGRNRGKREVGHHWSCQASICNEADIELEAWRGSS